MNSWSNWSPRRSIWREKACGCRVFTEEDRGGVLNQRGCKGGERMRRKCQSQGHEKFQESVVLPLSQMLRKGEVG